MRERVYAHGVADVRLKRRGPLYCRQNKSELTYHGIGFQHRGVSSYAATTTPECCRFGWRNRRKRESRTALISIVYVAISTTKFRWESDSRSSKLVAESKTRNWGKAAPVKICAHRNQRRLRRCRACSNRVAACCSGGLAHGRGPRASQVVGPRPTAATEAASLGGGMAHQAWPFRPGSAHCANTVISRAAASGGGGRATALSRGGRCHVSPAAPAATAEGVLFVKFIRR